jgi:hypothetical protein
MHAFRAQIPGTIPAAIAVATAASLRTAILRSLFRTGAAIAAVGRTPIALLGGALLFTSQLGVEDAQRSIQPAIDLRAFFSRRLRDAGVGAAIAAGAARASRGR